jgi:hypothetical protein
MAITQEDDEIGSQRKKPSSRVSQSLLCLFQFLNYIYIKPKYYLKTLAII